MRRGGFRKALNIRRPDGQVKQCEVRCRKNDTHGIVYSKKSGREREDVFVPRQRFKDFIDGTQTLVVCEKANASLEEPFVRKLPSYMSHSLFFGDLLLCYHGDGGAQQDLLVEDFVQIKEGTHPLWCMINTASNDDSVLSRLTDDDGTADDSSSGTMIDDEDSDSSTHDNQSDDEEDDESTNNDDDCCDYGNEENVDEEI